MWGSLQKCNKIRTTSLAFNLKKSSLSSPTSQQGTMQTSCTLIRAKRFPKAAISLEAGRQTASPLFQRHGVLACLDYKTSAHKWHEFPLGTHCSCNPATQYTYLPWQVHCKTSDSKETKQWVHTARLHIKGLSVWVSESVLSLPLHC